MARAPSRRDDDDDVPHDRLRKATGHMFRGQSREHIAGLFILGVGEEGCREEDGLAGRGRGDLGVGRGLEEEEVGMEGDWIVEKTGVAGILLKDNSLRQLTRFFVLCGSLVILKLLDGNCIPCHDHAVRYQ